MTLQMKRAIRRAAAIVCATLAACNSTGGHLVSMPFELGGFDRAAAGPLRFTASGTGRPWQIELDTAIISAGPFYFNAQAPQTGTLESGLVLLEAPTQRIVDALDPTLYPIGGGARGETGEAISLEIDLFPPDATQDLFDPSVNLLTSPGNAVAYAAGTATATTADGGALIVPFQGQIAIDLSKANPSNPPPALQRVNGAAVDLKITASPSTLRGRIDPTHWFDSADFSILVPAPQCPDAGPCTAWTPDGGALTWDKRSTFNSQVLGGIKARSDVYLFELDQTGGT